MERYIRFRYQPVRPLGKHGQLITGCAAHRKLSKLVAAEGTVLLKNDGTLPLTKGTRICPFGPGFAHFIFGGGGSAWVEAKGNISFSDALRHCQKQQELDVFLPLLDHYNTFTQDHGDLSNPITYSLKNLVPLPALPEPLYNQAKDFGGIALLCISRFSGECNTNDRSGGIGDFQLSPEEKALFDRLCADFEKIIVVLNTCGPISTRQFRNEKKVAAILYPMLSGGAAGEVLCEMLLGKCYPSGHLQDTFADWIDDYPCTANFEQFDDHVDYEEDIFVGYRYFETFAPEKGVYPFGFGLSYTSFHIDCESAVQKGNAVKLTVSVTNTGSFPGKEVVQVYLSAPQGKLGKAAKVLTTFQKTQQLLPGQCCRMTLSFDLRDFASFDDLGKICKSAFLLEKGEYTVKLGANARDCQDVLTFRLADDRICRQCHEYMAPSKLEKRLTADGSYESLPVPQAHDKPAPVYTTKLEPENLTLEAALKEHKLDALLASLSNAQLGELLHGHPITNASDTSGIGVSIQHRQPDPKIPLIPTADGGSGYRIRCGLDLAATFFPCPTALAQTWNPKLAEKMGKAGALELKENNAGIWLAPGMNIHRSPLCGRNFEYFSEDPLCSGLFAAAFIRGVQSQKIAATIKHFCCNNKETNRKRSDSRVSQRALREIYLRGFEIAIQKASPWAVMTSYNLVNGQQSSINYDAIQGILKGEWGYRGLVMTDWNAYSTLDQELLAGSDVKMPFPVTESTDTFDFDKAVAEGLLTREILLSAAKRVLEFMDHFE